MSRSVLSIYEIENQQNLNTTKMQNKKEKFIKQKWHTSSQYAFFGVWYYILPLFSKRHQHRIYAAIWLAEISAAFSRHHYQAITTYRSQATRATQFVARGEFRPGTERRPLPPAPASNERIFDASSLSKGRDSTPAVTLSMSRSVSFGILDKCQSETLPADDN